MADDDRRLKVTPSQTIGPFLHIGASWLNRPALAAAGSKDTVTVRGRLLDGAGEPVTDALIEIWQAEASVRPRRAVESDWAGFDRAPTGGDGSFSFTTLRPGVQEGPGGLEAPHLDVSIFARGLLQRLVTRVYLADEEAANAQDPVLALIPADRRHTLMAAARGEGIFEWDIHLQGPEETVFFAY